MTYAAKHFQALKLQLQTHSGHLYCKMFTDHNHLLVCLWTCTSEIHLNMNVVGKAFSWISHVRKYFCKFKLLKKHINVNIKQSISCLYTPLKVHLETLSDKEITLIEHLWTGTCEKPYKCEIYNNKTFKTARALKIHFWSPSEKNHTNLNVIAICDGHSTFTIRLSILDFKY